jgi:hypothetical protein
MGKVKRSESQCDVSNKVDLKKFALDQLAVQKQERDLHLLRILELEDELGRLKDRAIFLKGAMEAFKVMVEYLSQGTTPNDVHDHNVAKNDGQEGG